MTRPSVAIAIGIIAIYTIFGPLILYGIYALLDSLSQKKESPNADRERDKKDDPALWSGNDVKDYFRKLNKYNFE